MQSFNKEFEGSGLCGWEGYTGSQMKKFYTTNIRGNTIDTTK